QLAQHCGSCPHLSPSRSRSAGRMTRPGRCVPDCSHHPGDVPRPEEIVESLRSMASDELHNLAEAVRQVQIERAVEAGDHDAIIARAFEIGFGRDGLGVLPWVEAEVIVCPGGLVSKSRTNHRCRFVSADDVWVWDSGLLLR